MQNKMTCFFLVSEKWPWMSSWREIHPVWREFCKVMVSLLDINRRLRRLCGGRASLIQSHLALHTVSQQLMHQMIPWLSESVYHSTNDSV